MQRPLHLGLVEGDVLELAREVLVIGGHVEVAVAGEVEDDDLLRPGLIGAAGGTSAINWFPASSTKPVAALVQSANILIDQFALFQEGMELARFCDRKLSEVEKSVEIVLKESAEEWKTAPFEPDEPAGSEDQGRPSVEREPVLHGAYP